MSKRQYLATIPWQDSLTVDELRYAEPNIHSIIDILRSHGSRLSRIEEKLEDIVTNGTSSRLLDGDPPCEVCGEWSNNGRLCPCCERKFPWF
jgi:hypothetical protein